MTTREPCTCGCQPALETPRDPAGLTWFRYACAPCQRYGGLSRREDGAGVLWDGYAASLAIASRSSLGELLHPKH